MLQAALPSVVARRLGLKTGGGFCSQVQAHRHSLPTPQNPKASLSGRNCFKAMGKSSLPTMAASTGCSPSPATTQAQTSRQEPCNQETMRPSLPLQPWLAAMNGLPTLPSTNCILENTNCRLQVAHELRAPGALESLASKQIQFYPCHQVPQTSKQELPPLPSKRIKANLRAWMGCEMLGLIGGSWALIPASWLAGNKAWQFDMSWLQAWKHFAARRRNERQPGLVAAKQTPRPSCSSMNGGQSHDQAQPSNHLWEQTMQPSLATIQVPDFQTRNLAIRKHSSPADLSSHGWQQ